MRTIISSRPRQKAGSAVNRRWLLVALLAAPALVGGSARGQQTPPREPHAYRTDHYRAPTPRTLRGARVVSTSQAAALWKQGEAVFVDVLPRPPRPVDLPAGTIWRDRPRFDIPGSIWLPDTGYGALAPSMQAYFAAGLRKATHRRSRQACGHLLFARLLDVLERRQAGASDALHPRDLVPGRHRWLGGRGASVEAEAARAAPARVSGTLFS